MVKRLNHKLLVTPPDFSPTHPDFKVIGVFNPGAARLGDEIILMVRVAQASTLEDPGWFHSPRSSVEDGKLHYGVDRLRIHPDDRGKDHRKPLLEGGRRRLAFVSHLELVRVSADGYTVREIVRHDQLFGRTPWEEYGVEDPRITQIGDTYYITYVSVSRGMGVCTSLMTTRDFITFERCGVLFPCENKDVVLFPEKVNGFYYAYHRPVGHIEIQDLAIVSATSPDLVHWGRHTHVLGCAAEGWYSKRIGAGPPPIKTAEGWLTIFHGVREQFPGDPIGEYTAGAMLTPLNEPERPIALSEQPFFRAEEEHEVSGYVKNVVFPSGTVRDLDDADKLHVYYGCADSSVAVTTFSIRDILTSLRRL